MDAINDQIRTPLHLSVNSSVSDSDSSYAIEECLLGFGAKADALDCRGRMPIRYAFTKIGRYFIFFCQNCIYLYIYLFLIIAKLSVSFLKSIVKKLN